MKPLGPCMLEGKHVRLEPLRAHHADGLFEAASAQDPHIWDWMPERLTSREAVDRFIAGALQSETAGEAFPFVVKLQEDGRIVGSTQYLDVQQLHRGAEVGWTWYVHGVWGTVVNPEVKHLLFAHAFEEWGAARVTLKTDNQNLHSQAAIKKLGAQYEGTLRHHRIRPDGTLRDTVMFSILAEEWEGVKEALEWRVRH